MIHNLSFVNVQLHAGATHKVSHMHGIPELPVIILVFVGNRPFAHKLNYF